MGKGKRGRNGGGGGMLPGTVSISDLPDVVCKTEDSGGIVFGRGVMLKEVSALVSADGKPGILTRRVAYCVKCMAMAEGVSLTKEA